MPIKIKIAPAIPAMVTPGIIKNSIKNKIIPRTIKNIIAVNDILIY